ncbi:hypothetical protein ACOSP7_014481 [Xanthoceras sorbifolium]
MACKQRNKTFPEKKKKKSCFTMEAVMKMRLFLAMVVMVMAVSGVQNVSAADSPAPSPTSDASAFLPTFFASLAALAFGLFF